MSESTELAQATIIGSLIEDNTQAGSVFSRVRIEDFDGQYRLIAEAIHGLRLDRKPFDVLAITDEMTRRGTIGRIGGAAEIHRVHGFHFGSVDYSVQILARVARLRRLEQIGLQTVTKTAASDADPLTVAQHVLTEAQAIVDGIESEGDITTPTLREFLAGADPEPDWVIPGLIERGDRLILTGSEGLGKALATSTMILTANRGWVPMGLLNVGDDVFGPDGKPTRILAATEIMLGRPCYRVEFSDGSVIEADEQHLWAVEDLRSRERASRHGVQAQILTTGQIHDSQRVRHGEVANYSVEATAPLEYPERDLPIHPYVLGAWLGDGSSRGSGFTCADQEIIDEIAKHEPVRKISGPYQWSISDGHKGNRKSLRTRLRALGVLQNKSIPADYMQSSAAQRLELLRGLMDTDGCITAGKNSHVCEFTATDYGLAYDVYDLALTLGIKATINAGRATIQGRDCGPKWRVSFTTDLRVFTLARKAERQVRSTTRRARLRYITRVARIESTPVRCIQVDRPDGLFLAGRSLITTHNSVLFRQLAVCAAAGIHPFTHQSIAQHRVLYVDVENGVGQLRRALRGLSIQAEKRGAGNAGDNMFLECLPSGLDLTKPEDEAWLVSRVSALQPALLVIGPIYRLHAKNPNDEEPARCVTRVLDRCRAAANCALILEAHAGHTTGVDGMRHVRPTGSSLWLRWPEFGYGLRAGANFDPHTRQVQFVPWRGDRSERDWPKSLRAGGAWPWVRDDLGSSRGESWA